MCARDPSGLSKGGSKERQKLFSTDLARPQKALLPEGTEAKFSPIQPIWSKRACVVAFLHLLTAAL